MRAERESRAARPRRGGSGFTLVEALVVAVIMGIMAAVAVPMYSGYIKNQRKQAAAAVARTAAVTATSLYRRNNAIPSSAELNAALSLPDPSLYTITVVVAEGSTSVYVVDAADPSCTANVEFK